MKPNLKHVALFACALAAGLALAQQKTMGEKWRTRMSMESEGFSMPARTMEVCVPQGKPEEALMQQDSNCAVSNMKTVGNRTSADIKCTGKDAMSGHWEMEKLSATSARGTMDAKNAEMSMKMKYEYTRLGEACEIKAYAPPPVVQAPVVPQVDVCQALYDSNSEGDLPSLAEALLRQQPQANGQMGNCTRHAVFKKFCAAVQTPRGFSELESSEIYAREEAAAHGKVKFQSTGDAAADALVAEQQKLRDMPLAESMKACGLGSDAAAVAKLQAKVLPIAEKENHWGFLLHYATDTWYPQLVTLAKAECSGRSFTNASNSRYQGLCRSYGLALVRDNRAGALDAAGCTRERVDVARGICIGAGEGRKGAPQFADEARSGGSAEAPAEATAEEKKSNKDKAKDALDKGKKALRGLLGG